MTRKSAFTMAEILLSLTIIGVVAAITLPSLIGNINERAWNTQRQALHARFAQALPMMNNLSVYSSASEFISSGLSNGIKLTNVCQQDKIEDCGINKTAITAFDGTTKSNVDFKWTTMGLALTDLGYSSTDTVTETDLIAGFETQNGESIVVQYNPKCTSDSESLPQNITGGEVWLNTVCVNFIYDLNGAKGPNKIGKDMGFMTAFYPTETEVVAPLITSQVTGTASSGTQGQANFVAAKAPACITDYRLPSKNEAKAIALNGYYTSGTNIAASAPVVISSSKASGNGNIYYYTVEGKKVKTTLNSTTPTSATRCVKR